MTKFVDIEGLSVDMASIDSYRIRELAKGQAQVVVSTKDGKDHHAPRVSREKAEQQLDSIRNQMARVYPKTPAIGARVIG